jgi:lipoprotein-anchoring transpeptidase ErfK/SrfK
MNSILSRSSARRFSVAVFASALTIFAAGHAKAQDYQNDQGSALGYSSDDNNYDPAQPTIGNEDGALPSRFQRTIVSFDTREAPGTIIIDTRNTYLYLVLGQGQAMRYGVGVGREGFAWAGTQTVSRKAEWPDWTPPPEMIARQPYLPRFTTGGPGNPLGARAMYLGGSEYRIHGTNDPATIGKFVSSGCVRLTNEDVMDLYNRVRVGAKVIVLPASGARTLNTIATLHPGASGNRSASLRDEQRSVQSSSTAID